MTCGIYLLKFTGTDRVYVGLSDNIERRWSCHKHNLTHGQSPKKLLEAFIQYGMPHLEVICECAAEELEDAEKEALEIFDSINNGFNSREGGTVGAGITVSGEGNGRAKYSNEQIEEAFKLLTSSHLTQAEIAKTAGISLQAVSHISAGTGHRWLSKKYPEKYVLLVSEKRTNNIFEPTVLVNTKTDCEHLIRSYKELQDLTGCAYSSAVSIIAGQLQHLFDTWKLKYPVPKKDTKKPKYILKKTSTTEVVEVSSKLKFFTDNQLINRKKFSEFLRSGVLGSVYQGWELVSIC